VQQSRVRPAGAVWVVGAAGPPDG